MDLVRRLVHQVILAVREASARVEEIVAAFQDRIRSVIARKAMRLVRDRQLAELELLIRHRLALFDKKARVGTCVVIDRLVPLVRALLREERASSHLLLVGRTKRHLNLTHDALLLVSLNLNVDLTLRVVSDQDARIFSRRH